MSHNVRIDFVAIYFNNFDIYVLPPIYHLC